MLIQQNIMIIQIFITHCELLGKLEQVTETPNFTQY